VSTTLKSDPTFSERVVGSDLIAIATIEERIGVEPISFGDDEHTFGYFQVALRDVFKGDPAEGRVVVRIVGEGSPPDTKWPVPVDDPGAPLLMLLVRDVDEHQSGGVYVPVFGAAYPVSERGTVDLPKDVLDDLTATHVEISRGAAQLAGLRRVVDIVVIEQQQRRRDFEDVEPAALLRRDPAEVTEMPPRGTRRTRMSTAKAPRTSEGVAGISTDVADPPQT
jgi:hypothetical protein